MKDKETTVADAQVITSTGGTTDKYDSKAAKPHLGKGQDPTVALITVSAIDASSGNETYTAQLRHDGDSAFGSPTAVGAVLTIDKAITAPKQFILIVPHDIAGEQYWDVLFTLGGTTPSITVDVEFLPLSAVEKYADLPQARDAA